MLLPQYTRAEKQVDEGTKMDRATLRQLSGLLYSWQGGAEGAQSRHHSTSGRPVFLDFPTVLYPAPSTLYCPLFSFETRCHYGVQAALRLKIFLRHPPGFESGSHYIDQAASNSQKSSCLGLSAGIQDCTITFGKIQNQNQTKST